MDEVDSVMISGLTYFLHKKRESTHHRSDESTLMCDLFGLMIIKWFIQPNINIYPIQ